MSFPKYPEYRDSGIAWLGVIPAHWSVIPLTRIASKPGSLFIDGDWVESLTALVEDHSGALRLVTWQEVVGVPVAHHNEEMEELCVSPS